MNFSRLLLRAYNGHVLMVAFLMGLFGATLIGVQETLKNAENSIKESLSVIVFLQRSDPAPANDSAALIQSLKSQDPDIVSINYTSQEQAYQEALKDPNLAKSLQLLKSNPLPASLTINYSDAAWWSRADPTEKLHALPNVQEIRWDPQALALFKSLHRWRLWAVRFSAFVGIVLGAWAFLGLYRFLALASDLEELAAHLGVGLLGGALAWGLWGVGLHSIEAEISSLRPAWVWIAPLIIGVITGLGCFGLEVRHAE